MEHENYTSKENEGVVKDWMNRNTIHVKWCIQSLQNILYSVFSLVWNSFKMALLTACKLNLNVKTRNALQNLEGKQNTTGIVEELQTNKISINVTQQSNKTCCELNLLNQD